MRHVEVDVLRPAWRLGPGAAEGGEEVDLRVEVEAKGCKVGPEGEGDQVGVRLRRPDEG